MKLASVDIQQVIKKTLDSISQFQTEKGLFKTFRVDYSELACPNDYINEDKAVFIDTKYDHSFILEILLRLRRYFSCEEEFLKIIRNGIRNIFENAVVSSIPTMNVVKTLQWRYYNIDHQGQGKILPDIDDTGRNLIVIERVRGMGMSFFQV